MNPIKTVTINVVKFEDLNKESKRKAKDNIADVLYDVLDYHVAEIKKSKDEYLNQYRKGNLSSLGKDNYLLTGVCYDYDFLQIDHENFNSVENEVNRVFMNLKKSEKKNVFSDEYITDFCEGNGIYFLENGEEFYSLERLIKGI